MFITAIETLPKASLMRLHLQDLVTCQYYIEDYISLLGLYFINPMTGESTRLYSDDRDQHGGENFVYSLY